jgi:hypothetical protein
MSVKESRIMPGDILVGKPLLWDVFDEGGALLLKEGSVIGSEFQLSTLLKRGLYVHALIERSEKEAPVIVKQSPFEIIDEVYFRLCDLFQKTDAYPKMEAKIIKFCDMLLSACNQDANAALGMMFFCKDCRYPVMHSIQAALICKIVTDSLGSSREEQLATMAAALTMNISMIGLQEKLYYQKITPDEGQKEQIKTHPERSVSYLEKCGVKDTIWLNAVAQHHELLNGQGYPKGLQNDAICRNARILTISDMYCAKISNRAYRCPILPTTALRDLFMRTDNALDKNISQILIKRLGMYPPGLFVELQNGEIAVVTHVGKDVRYPMLCSLTNSSGVPLMKPTPRDCTIDQYAIKKGIPIAEAAVEVNRCQLWGYM